MAGQEGEIAELRQWKGKIASCLPFAVATYESLASPTIANDGKFQPAFRTRTVKGSISCRFCRNTLEELGPIPRFLFCHQDRDWSRLPRPSNWPAAPGSVPILDRF